MSNVVNLNQFRKQRKRAERAETATQNRTRFGRSKATRKVDDKTRDTQTRKLDDSRLDQTEDDDSSR